MLCVVVIVVVGGEGLIEGCVAIHMIPDCLWLHWALICDIQESSVRHTLGHLQVRHSLMALHINNTNKQLCFEQS